MTLEDETGLINVVVKPNTFERLRSTILQHNILKITARVQRDGDAISLLATHFEPLQIPQPQQIRSRDFR